MRKEYFWRKLIVRAESGIEKDDMAAKNRSCRESAETTSPVERKGCSVSCDGDRKKKDKAMKGDRIRDCPYQMSSIGVLAMGVFR